MAQINFNRDELKTTTVTGAVRTVLVAPNGTTYTIVEQGGGQPGAAVAEFIESYEEAVRAAVHYADGGAVANDPAYRVVNTNGFTLH